MPFKSFTLPRESLSTLPLRFWAYLRMWEKTIISAPQLGIEMQDNRQAAEQTVLAGARRPESTGISTGITIMDGNLLFYLKLVLTGKTHKPILIFQILFLANQMSNI